MKKQQKLWWFVAVVFVATAAVWWRQTDAPPKPDARPMVRDDRTTVPQVEWVMEGTIIKPTNSIDASGGPRVKQFQAVGSGFKEFNEAMRSLLTNFSQIHTSRSRPVPSRFQNIDAPPLPKLKQKTNSAFAANAER